MTPWTAAWSSIIFSGTPVVVPIVAAAPVTTGVTAANGIWLGFGSAKDGGAM